jgi:arsenate reductase
MLKEKIKMVFVCVENARRSQMAQGFAEAFGQEKVEVYSAGSRPASKIDPMIIEGMREQRIDFSSKSQRV